MTPDERIASIGIKLERAKKHMQDLQVEARSFLDTTPYTVGVRRNPQTRQLIYFVLSVRETPIMIAAVIGDVLQNLRSALDHLAYHLVFIGTGGVGPFKHVYFPISENATKYKAERLGKVKGMRVDAINAIDAIAPYGGGNDMLWHLHQLNNIDKHRMVMTVGSAFRGFNLAPIIRQFQERVYIPAEIYPMADVIPIDAANTHFPLKERDILYADLPDAVVNEKMQFFFQIAFSEPGVIEGKPLIETLQQMIDVVDNIALTFRPMIL